MLLRLRRLITVSFLFCGLPTPAEVLCVDLSCTNPTPPYTNWVTAATNIQDAVDAASSGDLVLVTNGVYRTGGRAVVGTMTNRVVVDKPLTVRSVNGPQATAIQGRQLSGTYNGDGTIRCVYLANGATLSGFTLIKGATRNFTGDDGQQSGGGVWCESAAAVVSNCVLVANSASASGGGARNGTLNNCTLTENQTGQGGALGSGWGGGAAGSTLSNCTLISNSASYGGGGAAWCVLNKCVLTRNWAVNSGGGAAGGALTNCVLTENSAGNWGGGGMHDATAYNCTISANSAYYYGGGAYGGTLNNCILYFNTAPNGPNYWANSSLHYCCSTPQPTNGFGNIMLDPLFVAPASGDFRVQADSPCINAGCNASVASDTDMDGKPRIRGGTVDIGAYELQNPASVISYAWLHQYGLPANGTADFAEMDNDGMNNWQEWMAGTDPTNGLSALTMLAPSNGLAGVTLSWQSVSGKTYYLQRGANLVQQPGLAPLQSNIVGQAGMTSFTDFTATNAGAYFYRVGVQQ